VKEIAHSCLSRAVPGSISGGTRADETDSSA
jgi:hypothetical protein